MITLKLIKTIEEIQQIQRLATLCPCNVGLHSQDGTIMIDAKSYIGMYALDFNQPILVVCEDESFHRQIKSIGENM